MCVFTDSVLRTPAMMKVHHDFSEVSHLRSSIAHPMPDWGGNQKSYPGINLIQRTSCNTKMKPDEFGLRSLFD